MDKELKDKLVANGFDVDVTLQRFMNNENLYFKFLKKLPADQNFVSFVESIQSGDCETAFRSGHTLKGVLSNLGVDSVLHVLEPMVEKLRANSMEGVPEALDEFKSKYENAIKTIGEL